MLRLATKFIPQVRHFETAYRAGFRCAEFWLDADLLCNWESVASLARDYPLQYALHFPNRGDLHEEAIAGAICLYEELDCTALVIHEPMRGRYQERLLQLNPSLRLAVENHNLDPAGFEDWALQNRWLTLDVEHLWYLTLKDAPLADLIEKLENFLQRFSDRLAHVHLPGYLPGYQEHRPMYCSREMVFAVLTLLEDYGFSGLVVSEADLEYQNRSELRMDTLLFDRWRDVDREARQSRQRTQEDAGVGQASRTLTANGDKRDDCHAKRAVRDLAP